MTTLTPATLTTDNCWGLLTTAPRKFLLPAASWPWLMPGLWYAQRAAGLYMHRMIVGLDVAAVDHRDGNGLNNRRANLRAATFSQNNQNARKRPGCTSRYKGVDWHKGAWRARITAPSGRQVALGHYTTLQLIEQTIGESSMQVSVAQAAIEDTLLRAHQEEVARLEQQQREDAA